MFPSLICSYEVTSRKKMNLMKRKRRIMILKIHFHLANLLLASQFIQVFLPSGQEQPVILVAIILLEKTFMIHTRSLSVLHSILICSFTLPIDTFACTAFLVHGLLEGAEVTLYLSSFLVSFHC